MGSSFAEKNTFHVVKFSVVKLTTVYFIKLYYSNFFIRDD